MISPVIKWVEEKTGLGGSNLNPQTLRAWQQEKLNDVVDYARKNTKFYAERLGSTSNLTELPFTYPSELANDPLAFLAIPQSEVVRIATLANSGTTNLKKRIFFSKNDLERTKEFFAVGMSAIVSKDDRAQILISNRTENSLGRLLQESLASIGVKSEISPAIKSVSEAIEASRNAECLIGMPAEMLYMSRTAPNLRPKNVLLAADYIPQSVIDSIKETWNCQVFSHFGHTEFGYGYAVDCENHDGLHTRDADFIFEIVNPNTGKQVSLGESGELVITTLSNEAMPLIRYRTGNISRIINNPCKCGGKLHRLGRIEGRIGSNISISESKMLSIHQLDDIIFANSQVLGFEAKLQKDKERCTLYLTIEAHNKIDLTSLAAKLPQGINIEIDYGKANPFAHRGKRRINTIYI